MHSKQCCHSAKVLQAREAKAEDTQLAASDNEDLDAGELSDSEDQLDENAMLSKLADEAIRFQVRGWEEGHATQQVVPVVSCTEVVHQQVR